MKTNKKKILVPLLVLALVVTTIGGTLAWLMDKTEPVVNTFTVGNVNLTLNETTSNYKMIPGKVISKDPKVTLTAGSEDAFIFVEVDKSANFDIYMEYKMAEGWTKLGGVSGVDNVWYRTVKSTEAGKPYDVLLNNQVTVKEDVTNTQMTQAASNNPTLTFTGYAVQMKKNNTEDFTAQEAWAKASVK